MSALQRLVEKFVSEPDRVTPDEFCRLLEMLGYREHKKRGSERIFHKKGSSAMNVPTPKKGRFVKSPYVKRVIRLLGLEDYLESSKGS